MRELLRERDEAIDRTLTPLPSSILEALVLGIEQADGFAPGALFDDTKSGCAVGVALRVLFPKYRGRPARRFEFIRRRREVSLRSAHPEAAVEFPHLAALEQVFDRSVAIAEEANPDRPVKELAGEVAEYIAERCRHHLEIRATRARWQMCLYDDDLALGPSVVITR